MRQRWGFSVAPLLAIVSGSWLVACTAGNIGGVVPPGSSGSATANGSGAMSGGSSLVGDGGVVPITPNTGSTTYGWYEALAGTDCSKPVTALPPTRIWRLSAGQWANTVQMALGVGSIDPSQFPGDPIDPATGFSDNSTHNMVTLPLAQSYFAIGNQVSTSAAAGALQTLACLGTAPIATACGQQFVADYGSRLFRRPLTTDENTLYTTFLTSQSQLDSPAAAVSSVLRAMLLSPNFAYRTELGGSTLGQVNLTGHEIASLLSYTIADSPPDGPLLQAAAAGQLADSAVRETQARRLLALPGAKLKLADFWQQYLALGAIPASTGITAALGSSMIKETQTFFDKLVWGPAPGSFGDLLTANYTYADSAVAKVYGSSIPDPATSRLALPTGQRSGFLTQASILVQTSAASQAATVIHRGLLVRERLLCQTPPPPPPDVVADPNKFAKAMGAGLSATARENYDLFAMTEPTCNSCHQTFQPIGLAFEAYDALGGFRTTYPAPIGKPVVTSGVLNAAGDATGPYADVVQLAANIGKSKIGQYCFTEQFAEFALGRSVDLGQEACTIRGMGDFVASKGGAIQELFTSLAHVDTEYRRFHQ